MPNKKVIIDKDDIEFMVDLLMESSLSFTEIAKELGWSVDELNKQINYHGLSWIKTRKKRMSRGHAALFDILKKLIPNQEIITEYHIGERLKLDIYCPKYSIAIEYHGRQHFYFTGRFHKSKEDFIESQKRDQRKLELCQKQGIILIAFRYDDKLTEEAVFNRIIEALKNKAPEKEKPKLIKQSIKNNSYYKQAKKKHSARRKQIYQELKRKNSGSRRKPK